MRWFCSNNVDKTAVNRTGQTATEYNAGMQACMHGLLSSKRPPPAPSTPQEAHSGVPLPPAFPTLYGTCIHLGPSTLTHCLPRSLPSMPTSAPQARPPPATAAPSALRPATAPTTNTPAAAKQQQQQLPGPRRLQQQQQQSRPGGGIKEEGDTPSPAFRSSGPSVPITTASSLGKTLDANSAADVLKQQYEAARTAASAPNKPAVSGEGDVRRAWGRGGVQ